MYVMITMPSLLPTLPYNAIVTRYHNVCVCSACNVPTYIQGASGIDARFLIQI